MNKLHVKTGDTVMVMTGKDKGTKGKVTKAFPATGKIIVFSSSFSAVSAPGRLAYGTGVRKCADN